MTRVDREPYVFEHPGLEFCVTSSGRLGVRIGARHSSGGRLLFIGSWASEPFPIGWEAVAREWLARNDNGVRR